MPLCGGGTLCLARQSTELLCGMRPKGTRRWQRSAVPKVAYIAALACRARPTGFACLGRGRSNPWARDFTVLPDTVRLCEPTAPTILPAALVSVRRRHDLHDGSDPAQCFGRRPRVLSNVHVLPDADTLVPAHHEIVATFRPGLNSLCTDGGRARNCRNKTST